MEDLRDVGPPRVLGRSAPSGDDPESRALRALGDAIVLAPRVWIPAEAEEAFYRLNHLDDRLASLFGDTANEDPDEDEIEERAPAARRLIASHVLLDSWVDAFYDACRRLGTRVRVRRPGRVGRSALNGRPALLALRATWSASWSDEAIVARLRSGGSLRADPRPIVVHGDDRAADDLGRSALRPLEEGWQAFVDDEGAVTRLSFPPGDANAAPCSGDEPAR